MTQGNSQNVRGWVKLLLKRFYNYCKLEWFRGSRICLLWLPISPLFFPSWSCFPVKPASKMEVTLAAVGISRDEIQQGKPVAQWRICQWCIKGTQFWPKQLTQPPVPGSVYVWISTYLNIHCIQQMEEDKLEGKCMSLHLFQVHLHVLHWLMKAVHPSAAAKVSAPAACPCLAATVPPLTLCALNRQQSTLKPLWGSSSRSCTTSGWPGYQQKYH